MSTEPKQKEVLEFWGRPSQGTFRRVAVVQDAVVVEPVPSTREAIEKVMAMMPPAMVQVDMAKLEQKVAASMTGAEMQALYDKERDAEKPRAKRPRRRRDAFPNTGHTTESGRYGMFRTVGGHMLAVQRCLRALRPVEATFDVLYVTGLSGTIPAAVVAYLMQKEIVVLRKTLHGDYDTASHGSLVEGDATMVPGMRYMILDDFVSNAGTLRKLLKHLPSNGSLAGVCLYGHPRSKNEIEGGMAKVFHTYPDGPEKPPQRWHMVRRGRNSMLFDLLPQKEDA